MLFSENGLYFSRMRIKLTQGKYALIDKKDYPLISQYKWCVVIKAKQKYAVDSSGISMHRLILGLHYKDGKVSHHKDKNGLNNHRRNLQVFNNNGEHKHLAHNPAKDYFTSLSNKMALRELINKIRNKF